MKKKKRILVLILSMILVFSNTIFVNAEGETQEPQTEEMKFIGSHVEDYIQWKYKVYEYLGDLSDSLDDVSVFQLKTDNSSYSSGEFYRACKILLSSKTKNRKVSKTNIYYVLSDDGSMSYSHTTKEELICSQTLSDYRLGTSKDYWDAFYSQFYGSGDDIDDFYAYFESNPIYLTSFNTPYSFKDYECNLVSLSVYPEESDGSCKGDISSKQKVSTHFDNYFGWFYGFFYKNDPSNGTGKGVTPPPDDGGGDGDGGGNYDNFICYVNVTQVFYNLSLRNKMRFYWDVSKYPQFKNGFIELRAFPYNEAAKINEVDDAYWFSSLTLSNKKENQKYFSLGNFDDGEYIAIDYYLDDYYQNFLEKFSEIIAPYNSGNYRFQLRVCDSEKNVRTNWITFDLDDVQREYSSSILDPNGNVVDDNVYDNEDFDSDFRDKGQTSDIYDKNDPDNNRLNDITDIEIDGMKFQTWLNSAYSNVKDFSSLLNYFYGWLPAELIYSIGVSIIIIITLRILGR